MAGNDRADRARQWANLLGAVFQILAAFLLPVAQAASGNPTPVDPAGYAFAIWGLIYLLALVYAVYQAFPSRRTNPLFRRVGWVTAGAFILCGLWEVVVPLGQLLLAQVILVGIFLCAGVAYARLVRSERAVVGRTARWLVGLPTAMLFGWVTAANAVSFTSEAARLGLVGGGIAEAVLGAALLLAGGVIASVVIRIGRAGPPQPYVTYGLAVLWALVAVVVSQFDSSILGAASALLAGAVVARALLVALRGRGGGAGTIPNTEVA
jgi:hypothetical protein